jgi:hypothetical protein
MQDVEVELRRYVHLSKGYYCTVLIDYHEIIQELIYLDVEPHRILGRDS